MQASDANASRERGVAPRHARACRGHPRLITIAQAEARGWPGRSPAMTKQRRSAPFVHLVMPALVAGIHALLVSRKLSAWLTGTRAGHDGGA